MMNKGGGSSKGSGSVIPSLQANRSQLPYGAIAGSQARPGAGGVNYFYELITVREGIFDYVVTRTYYMPSL